MAVRVEETNLLLVVTELEKPDCEPCRANILPEELPQEPKESKSGLLEWGERGFDRGGMRGWCLNVDSSWLHTE